MSRRWSMRTAALIVPALFVALGGCGGDSDAADVEGVEWRLVELTGVDIPAGASPTLLLEEGTASGDAGCNRFTGGYTLDGDSIEFGALAVTLMACEPDLGEFETAYLAALGSAGTIEVSADEMIVSSGDGGNVELRYEQP